MTGWRGRLEDRELERLRQAFEPGQVLPAPLEWPWRLLLAAVLCRQGRDFLQHRFRAWRALPGERWRDGPRHVVGIVQGGRSGSTLVRCASGETLWRFPDALEDPGALVLLERPRLWTLDMMHLERVRPVVWLERVDLATWTPDRSTLRA